MKAIIDGKCYDTEKAEKIFSFSKKIDKGPVFWNPDIHYAPYHSHDLYRTAKGNYFEHDKEDETIKPTSNEDAEYIVRTLDPDKYLELFDVEVEEA